MYKHITTRRENFQAIVDGHPVDLYFLHDEAGNEMAITNYGARVVEWQTPDRIGKHDDIVLGHASLDEYLRPRGDKYLGAAIGRLANRLADGHLHLAGHHYRIPLNAPPNSLHGGPRGFDAVPWEARQEGNAIHFTHLSPDGDQGFPGNLRVEMTYTLLADEGFVIDIRATSDRPTVFNPTHHSYFNLRGEGRGTILDHLLHVRASRYTPVDEFLVPTGDILSVEGTPFDFRDPSPIGARVGDPDEQLLLAGGYDHNWFLDHPGDPSPVATLHDPVSARTLRLFADTPGLQVYTANAFDGTATGKNGLPLPSRAAIALEPQAFPDAPNQPHFPSTVLCPGETFRRRLAYKITIH